MLPGKVVGAADGIDSTQGDVRSRVRRVELDGPKEKHDSLVCLASRIAEGSEGEVRGRVLGITFQDGALFGDGGILVAVEPRLDDFPAPEHFQNSSFRNAYEDMKGFSSRSISSLFNCSPLFRRSSSLL